MATAEKPTEYSVGAPELTADPYGGFGRIREEAPVARGRLWDDAPIWIITRHEDVSAVLTDSRFVNNSRSLPDLSTDLYADSLTRLGIPEKFVPYLSQTLTHIDPPDHTRLRKLVSRAFSARRVTCLMPRVK
ncbi:cytochrome P450, partial [Streptomyces sp. 2MCAF27]